MLELHWVAVPLVTLVVLAILVWGMRKAPAKASISEIQEIMSDDSSSGCAFTFAPSLEPLSVSLVTSRRLLTHTWGADTPDLTIAYWVNPESPTIRLKSFQQTFLPLQDNLSGALAAMENRIFDTALEQDVPERSRLLTAWSFIHLPSRRQDLVVQSFFAGSHLDHKFFLMDADGKLGRIHLETETSGDLLIGSGWSAYRCALAAIEDEAGAPCDLQPFLRNFETAARAHSWLAHFANRERDAGDDVLRHTALALELDPDNHLARLEKSRAGGDSALREAVAALKDYLASQTDDEVQAGYLLAQSLLTLGQGSAARMLCEMLLAEETPNEATSRLLRLIRQCERGAQT